MQYFRFYQNFYSCVTINFFLFPFKIETLISILNQRKLVINASDIFDLGMSFFVSVSIKQ